MKNKLFQVRKIDRQHIQFFLTLMALAMLILGVGAPSDGGGATI